MAKQTKGDRFPLLVYRRWGKMLRLPSLLIAITAGGVWWFARTDSEWADRAWLFIVLGVIGALIFLYSALALRGAYVQCLPNYVKIRTPFLAVVVSYKRILQVRPVEFHSQLPLADLKPTQLRLLRPFLGHTVLLMELKGFPASERRLRRWLPWFMFASDVSGFVLVVENWMALSQQVSAFSDRWISRRQARERPAPGQMY